MPRTRVVGVSRAPMNLRQARPGPHRSTHHCSVSPSPSAAAPPRNPRLSRGLDRDSVANRVPALRCMPTGQPMTRRPSAGFRMSAGKHVRALSPLAVCLVCGLGLNQPHPGQSGAVACGLTVRRDGVNGEHGTAGGRTGDDLDGGSTRPRASYRCPMGSFWPAPTQGRALAKSSPGTVIGDRGGIGCTLVPATVGSRSRAENRWGTASRGGRRAGVGCG
jgi:hypothetical protein